MSEDKREQIRKLAEQAKKELEQADELIKGRRKNLSPFTFLPKGEHSVRILPDKEGKLFAVARIHQLKYFSKSVKKDKNGDEVEEIRERNRFVVCGRGPDGQGYCPICDYASRKYEEGDKSVSWIFSRPMLKILVYVHRTTEERKFRDVVNWGPGIITTAIVTSKTLAGQIVSLLRRLSSNGDVLFSLYNLDEEAPAIYINYPASRDASPQVSLDIEKVPPIPEEKIPDFLKDENDPFSLKKVYVDFTDVPPEEELEEALKDYLEWYASRSGDQDTAKTETSSQATVKEQADDTKGTEVTQDVERTPASEGDPKPACFGNFTAGPECQSCVYLSECVEATASV